MPRPELYGTLGNPACAACNVCYDCNICWVCLADGPIPDFEGLAVTNTHLAINVWLAF